MTAHDAVRVAAVGDIHMDADVAGRYRPELLRLGTHADVLLLAGDLTRHGTMSQAEVVAREFSDLPVPVVAVLGNHDYHSDQADLVTKTLESAGITVLECTGVVLNCHGIRLGIGGTKGFCGGFADHRGSEFGEPQMKAFMGYSRSLAEGFGAALRDLDCDVRVGVTHYSPAAQTLSGEPPELYPFLGSEHLGAALDSTDGVALAVHGHAHSGTELGMTTGGVNVRNVAYPVIQRAYRIYEVAT